MNKTAKATCCVFFAVAFILCAISAVYSRILPDKFYRCDDGGNRLSISSLPEIKTEPALNGGFYTDANPSKNITMKLFGLLPIKQAHSIECERPVLIPLGNAFGLKMFTDGVIVTEFGEVESDGKMISPARDCGIEKGDIIKAINGVTISYGSDIPTALALNPQCSEVDIIRDEKIQTIEVNVNNTTAPYKLGVWVRSSTAGIGTMTFLDVENNVFAGLGHGVCDVDTGVLMPLLSGECVAVNITDVIKGTNGKPGELCGNFTSNSPLAEINMNTQSGIFGKTRNIASLNIKSESVPMAFKQEIVTGKAEIICTVDGTVPQRYEIEIEKINLSENSSDRNMIVRITDNALLSATGGIVQGMSGSPIIQNGMLVGAVTHVFVNDSTRGYAIFSETMYNLSKNTERVEISTLYIIFYVHSR